jgi:alpha-D-xyloside xylohydrolase
MFGPALLVSPVTEPDVTTWETYLPKTQGGWFDYHTGRHYAGGQTVTTSVSKAQIPVFVRAGSIIPLSGDEVLVYGGKDASFTLYEDDGTTMAYEQGKCSRINFRWDDAKGKLKVSRNKGRQFKITIHNTTK